jgi:hypothetical protein
VPHEPFHFLPDGRSYNFSPISDVASSNAQKWAGGVGGTATTWQRHYIQTAYADTLTKLMIKRLKRVGIWKKALVIVTADHGISFDPKTYRRIALPGNFGGIANPPLFVKYPGQTKGAVSDVHTHSIDIVPTIAQVLGIELPYKAEGVPISEDGPEGPITISNGLKNSVTEQFSTFLAERSLVLQRAARELGAHTGLFQLGPSSNLLGRRAPSGSRSPRSRCARSSRRPQPARRSWGPTRASRSPSRSIRPTSWCRRTPSASTRSWQTSCTTPCGTPLRTRRSGSSRRVPGPTSAST